MCTCKDVSAPSSLLLTMYIPSFPPSPPYLHVPTSLSPPPSPLPPLLSPLPPPPSPLPPLPLRQGKNSERLWRTRSAPSRWTRTYLATQNCPGTTSSLRCGTSVCLKRSRSVTTTSDCCWRKKAQQSSPNRELKNVTILMNKVLMTIN